MKKLLSVILAIVIVSVMSMSAFASIGYVSPTTTAVVNNNPLVISPDSVVSNTYSFTGNTVLSSADIAAIATLPATTMIHAGTLSMTGRILTQLRIPAGQITGTSFDLNTNYNAGITYNVFTKFFENDFVTATLPTCEAYYEACINVGGLGNDIEIAFYDTAKNQYTPIAMQSSISAFYDKTKNAPNGYYACVDNAGFVHVWSNGANLVCWNGELTNK